MNENKFMKYSFELVDKAIEKHNLKEVWANTLYEMEEEETRLLLSKKRNTAVVDYLRLIWSPKNDGSEAYALEAVNTVLDLKPAKARYRGSTTTRFGMRGRY